MLCFSTDHPLAQFGEAVSLEHALEQPVLRLTKAPHRGGRPVCQSAVRLLSGIWLGVSAGVPRTNVGGPRGRQGVP
ncbi:hypothetical protein [Rhodococcus ruber]